MKSMFTVSMFWNATGPFDLCCKTKTSSQGPTSREEPRSDRPTGGIIFLNDEGSETGGLVWGGSKDEKGNIKSHGHLSFDQYMVTQVVAVSAFEEDGEKASRMTFTDWRNRDGETERTGFVPGNRMLLKIDRKGSPVIQFLDDRGNVTTQIPTILTIAS